MTGGHARGAANIAHPVSSGMPYFNRDSRHPGVVQPKRVSSLDSTLRHRTMHGSTSTGSHAVNSLPPLIVRRRASWGTTHGVSQGRAVGHGRGSPGRIFTEGLSTDSSRKPAAFLLNQKGFVSSNLPKGVVYIREKSKIALQADSSFPAPGHTTGVPNMPNAHSFKGISRGGISTRQDTFSQNGVIHMTRNNTIVLPTLNMQEELGYKPGGNSPNERTSPAANKYPSTFNTRTLEINDNKIVFSVPTTSDRLDENDRVNHRKDLVQDLMDHLREKAATQMAISKRTIKSKSMDNPECSKLSPNLLSHKRTLSQGRTSHTHNHSPQRTRSFPLSSSNKMKHTNDLHADKDHLAAVVKGVFNRPLNKEELRQQLLDIDDEFTLLEDTGEMEHVAMFDNIDQSWPSRSSQVDQDSEIHTPFNTTQNTQVVNVIQRHFTDSDSDGDSGGDSDGDSGGDSGDDSGGDSGDDSGDDSGGGSPTLIQNEGTSMFSERSYICPQ